MTPNEKLRRAREQRGWTQEQLAGHLGVSPRSVSNWERGERAPQTYFAEKLRDVLGKSAAELGFGEEPASLTKERQRLLHQSSMAERVQSAFTIVGLAWEAWEAARPKEVVPALLDLLRRMERYQGTSEKYRLEIQSMRISCHGILGLVFFDRLDFDQAIDQCTRAYALAEEVHDAARATVYLMLLGDALRRKEDARKGIDYMDLARNSSVGATRGHACIHLAPAYAHFGDAKRSHRCIAEAFDLLGFSGEGAPLTQREFGPFGVCVSAANCFCHLHQPAPALEWFEKAEDAIRKKSDHPRWEATIQMGKAQALCEMGDLASGVEFAKQGLACALESQSQRLIKHVHTLLLSLERSGQRGEAHVRELREMFLSSMLQPRF